MHSRIRREILKASTALALALLSACAGGAPPPDSSAPDARPAGQIDDPRAPDADLFTATGRVVITNFRIDLPKMRNIYALYGFFPDRWDRMEQIPFTDIREFLIRSVVDNESFGRLYRGREDFQLNQQEIFQVSISKLDGTQVEYIAIIPKLRGFRDGQRWELSMAGNPSGIDRIVLHPHA